MSQVTSHKSQEKRKNRVVRIFFILIVVSMIFFSPEVSRGEQFQESYYVNRAKACVHYFFSLFEKNPRDAEAIAELLVDKDLVMIYPWGELKSKEEVRKWIKNIPSDFYDAHHIKDIKVIKTSANNYSVVLDVQWQNQGNEGQFDSAHLTYELEMVDDGGRFPKIKKLHSRTAGK
ncbi:MAG: nuclear transport factor 2 family protein [Candidatus Omnitrophota bacterium]